MNKKSFWKECDNKRLEALLSETKDLGKVRHIQAVYLKSCYALKAEDIAKVVGLSKGYIWYIHAKYRQMGEAAFDLGNRGGRYHNNLTIQQEESIISDIAEAGDSGTILEISSIKSRYEALAGKSVNKTVIYRMLKRHGWRKIAPRPNHPKNNKEAMDSFKKNSHKWFKAA